jgi:hypothetical protein
MDQTKLEANAKTYAALCGLTLNRESDAICSLDLRPWNFVFDDLWFAGEKSRDFCYTGGPC